MKLPTAASCGVSALLPEQGQLSIQRFLLRAALLLDVFLDQLFRRSFSHRSNVTPVTPKLPSPQNLSDLRVRSKHFPCTQTLEHLHDSRRRPSPGHPHKHMHMIPVRPDLLNLILIPSPNLPQRCYQSRLIFLPSQHLLAILDTHHHVIPNLIDAMAAKFYIHTPGLYPLNPFPANSSPQQAAGYPLPL